MAQAQIPPSSPATKPVSGARGGSYARGLEAKRRILDIAWQAFADRGFRGASMNEIARDADLTMAGLLHHYPSKVKLFAAVLQARENDDESRFYSLFSPEPSAIEVLDAFVTMAKLNTKRYSFVQLTHLVAAESARGDHPAAQSAREHYRRTRKLLADAARRSIASGEIRGEIDPDRFALEVTAMVEGIENQWLHDTNTINLGRAFAAWAAELKTRIRAGVIASEPHPDAAEPDIN